MIIDIKIPSPGESITEVEILTWLVEDGDIVEKDQELAEVESDKATLPLIAEDGGKIQIIAAPGETINVGTVACKIDTSVEGVAKKVQKEEEKVEEKQAPEVNKKVKETIENNEKTSVTSVKVSPLARKKMNEYKLSVDDVVAGLERISTNEVDRVVAVNSTNNPISQKNTEGTRDEQRNKISNLRKKLSKRLVAVRNETAMLTTFNEVDMSNVIALRKKYQKKFTDKHGIKLGFMSFFTKAVAEALKLYPNVNSMIDGEELVSFNYSDIGIAVQTDKGLMVPVLRNTEIMGLADIEKNIMDLANKARSFRISIDEMTGGTFTITNGGIFGSMLSTPIINPPQAGILGMHNIVERPVAVNGKVEIRPIMYLALSYDHRIIDGRDSVSFLKTIKEFIENPYKILLGGTDPDKVLLDL